MAWMMGEESDRARVLGVLRLDWDWPLERIAEAAGEDHGPGTLSEAEEARLAAPAPLEAAPDAVRGDYPDWLEAPHIRRVFGERARRPRARPWPGARRWTCGSIC